jgi:hypothetical protein
MPIIQEYNYSELQRAALSGTQITQIGADVLKFVTFTSHGIEEEDAAVFLRPV